MKLTPRQTVILKRMCARNMKIDGPETGSEMALGLWGTGSFTSIEQGQRSAEQLVKKGLAEKLGTGPMNARCYGPTLAGRELIIHQEPK